METINLLTPGSLFEKMGATLTWGILDKRGYHGAIFELDGLYYKHGSTVPYLTFDDALEAVRGEVDPLEEKKEVILKKMSTAGSV